MYIVPKFRLIYKIKPVEALKQKKKPGFPVFFILNFGIGFPKKCWLIWQYSSFG
jgi:hypothetical protein